MAASLKPQVRLPRQARPTGEKFEPQAAFDQAKKLYPDVMARLAE